MNLETFIVAYLPTALIAGVLGVIAMEVAMWLITRKGATRANMVVALGSLITRSREHAALVGAILHVLSGMIFALLYAWVMWKFGITHVRSSLTAGALFGTLQGVMVSLMLVWVVADRHPLEEFKEADLAIGLIHVVGHMAFGAVVGLVIGLSPL